MGFPTSEVGYTSAMPRREDHEVHKGHVVALGRGGLFRFADPINRTVSADFMTLMCVNVTAAFCLYGLKRGVPKEEAMINRGTFVNHTG